MTAQRGTMRSVHTPGAAAAAKANRKRAARAAAKERAYYQRSYNEMAAVRRRTERYLAQGGRVWGPADYIYWGVFVYLWGSMWLW